MQKGEFLDAAAGERSFKLVDAGDFDFAQVDDLETVTTGDGANASHIEAVLNHPLVEVEAIQNANFTVVVDGVNSTGGIAIPQLCWML